MKAFMTVSPHTLMMMMIPQPSSGEEDRSTESTESAERGKEMEDKVQRGLASSPEERKREKGRERGMEKEDEGGEV